MKNKSILFLALLLLSSCTQRGCQRFNKKWQFSERQYHIEMYSGGEVIFKDDFNGILNQEESSDGVYYFKDGKMIEISGDYVITSK